ncbi:cytochrome P450 [Streptomyces sp. NBC_00829]|uniref:cytochrome P450 n=1 Tax=Streptomyces sp. NBC_00829 TaxID=2903679 RepID=UPI00386A1C13|nr:cytochrome P450 [Streptomyces sp. NBC_00829]
MPQAAELTEIPRARGGLPLLGHVLKLKSDPLGFLRSLRETGDLVRVDIGTMPIYVATSASAVNEVMVTQGRFLEKGRLFDRVRPLVGNGLATAGGETHRRHRRLIQPMFHRERLAMYAAVMSERAEALSDSWVPGQSVDVDQAMSAFTIEALAATLFSADIGRPAVESVRRDLPVILQNMLLRAASPKILDKLPIWRGFDNAAAGMRSVIDHVVATTRARADGDAERADLLSVLLAARDADTGEALTDEEVRDQLVTILFAGTETVSSTLAWAFHHLADNPEVEKLLVAEIEEVLGDRPVSFQDVPRLAAVQRVLDEVIRLHGVVLLMRRTIEPIELAGFWIPAGVEIAFSLYALHRDPDLYPDPDRFDPDRWLPERRAERPREAAVPFGAGNRKCIGDAFAWTEATIALATILRRWKLRPAPGSKAPQESLASMAHPDHVPMTVLPRDM